MFWKPRKNYIKSPMIRMVVVCVFFLLDQIPVTCGDIIFTDITKRTGIDFEHTDGGSGHHYIIESVCAGLALFDYDNDGDVDIYFLNGAPLRGTSVKKIPRNRLYRNEGNWKFTDVTENSGLGDTGYGLGVAVADYDNDGDLDVYLNNYGPNVLYRNNGDGSFTDVTEKAQVANGGKVGAGACFLDMDADGDLDLFASNYLKFTYEGHLPRSTRGYPQYGSPLDYTPEPDTLYRNNGDGTFTDVSESSGIGAHPGTGMGTVCGDFDLDGDTDIYVANDMRENFYFQNDGKGNFEEIGFMAGVAYDFDGNEQSSMGAECGDYDNDLLPDLLVTSYAGETTTLYRNIGNEMFQDATIKSGISSGTMNHVTWGNGLIDFDNDGDRDIFIATGHVQDNIDRYNDQITYKQRNQLLQNNGMGKFVNITDKCGDGLEVIQASRGAAFDDLDNDGDIDVVVLNSRTRPTILRNDTTQIGHWVGIRLKGVKNNRFGVGASVKITAEKLIQVDEVRSGRGYQSHYGDFLHFGLGSNQKLIRIEVRWPTGITERFTDIPVDRITTLIEGTGK